MMWISNSEASGGTGNDAILSAASLNAPERKGPNDGWNPTLANSGGPITQDDAPDVIDAGDGNDILIGGGQGAVIFCYYNNSKLVNRLGGKKANRLTKTGGNTSKRLPAQSHIRKTTVCPYIHLLVRYECRSNVTDYRRNRLRSGGVPAYAQVDSRDMAMQDRTPGTPRIDLFRMFRMDGNSPLQPKTRTTFISQCDYADSRNDFETHARSMSQ